MVMTAHGAGGFMPSGPEMGMYVQQTIIPPVQESKLDVGDVDMMDSERDVKTVKTSQRRTRRKDRRPDTSSDDESSDDSHYSRRREWGRRRSSKRTSGRHRSTSGYSERSNRSGYSVKSTGSTVAAMEFMQKMAESMTEMKDSMASVVEKVAQVQKQSARVEKENVPPLISSNVANFVPMSPEVGEALRAEAALNERQRMEAALGDFQAQLESEKNRQALEVAEEKARLESEGKRQALELEATRKELLALQEARERDREAAINVQKYYASQLREKRAATTQPNPRVEVPMPSQVPAQTAQTTADNHFSAQLQATLRNFQQAKVKNDAASGSRSATQVKTEQSSEKRSPPGRTPPGGSDPPKKDAGKSGSSRRSSARRISKRGNDPHDSDPDSDSDKRDDESSDDSDSSFFEESVPSAMTSKTSQAGTTVFTYKRYVNASALEDFNEKSSLSTRIRWLEKFQSMAVQGGWSDKMRIYEMKLKLPSSARDWRYNLDEDVRHSWKRFLKALKEKYCKAKTSDSERYYSMTQKKTEAPLEFFYRLNRVADKAGINFRKSSKERDRHFKVFMKKLLDSSLRSTLQGQRLHSLEDLEFVLKQYEEMHQDDDYETPPLDNKADSSSEDEKQVHFQETAEEISEQEVETGSSESQLPEDWSQVYRAMENAGWKPPPREFRPNDSSPRFGKPPDTSRFCETCKRFGHNEDRCWSGLQCDRCHQQRHPAQYCKTSPCKFCAGFHGEVCEGSKIFQKLRALASQGTFEMPKSLWKQALGGEENSGEEQLNL
ncbi:hypothetical protein PF002_g25197 [Phytophthora fragariae]|uniref:Retrotransposon gag domain-containing protein n=2 Tax=Phytophthora fragariae TaxID=53985 RepID=A0A6A3WPL1_9STRA|nr:hypothetical protein PF002_g25197 [Phytophthora fragariae]